MRRKRKKTRWSGDDGKGSNRECRKVKHTNLTSELLIIIGLIDKDVNGAKRAVGQTTLADEGVTRGGMRRRRRRGRRGRRGRGNIGDDDDEEEGV